MAATITVPAVASFFLIGPNKGDYVTFPEGGSLAAELARYGDDWTVYVRFISLGGPLLTGKPFAVLAALAALGATNE